jgi:hypothetical protein
MFRRLRGRAEQSCWGRLASDEIGGWREKSGRASHDAHLNDDKTVAKMGHPSLWLFDDVGLREFCWLPWEGGRSVCCDDDY